MIAAGHSAEQRHWFRAYQLLFASSIPIPEMLPADFSALGRAAAPDVVISEGEFPDQLPDPLRSSPVYQINEEALLLRIAGVGRYLVSKGREIRIDPDPAATTHDVRVYLLGTCIGALLHQRGFLVLHASGVVTDRGCALFTGESGAGKSTLLAELLRRGHKMVVDDVCAVRFDPTGRPIVVPSYPRTRLWADAAVHLDIDTTNLPRTRPTWDKFERQVADQFSDREVNLTHVFHLAGAYDGSECSLEQLGPMDAFTTVVDNTYRRTLLDGMNIRAGHFELASRVAQAVTVTRVRRPDGSNTVEELADLVLKRLGDS